MDFIPTKIFYSKKFPDYSTVCIFYIYTVYMWLTLLTASELKLLMYFSVYMKINKTYGCEYVHVHVNVYTRMHI